MKELAAKSAGWLEDAPEPTRIDRLARRIVLSRLALIRHGSLTLSDGAETVTFGTHRDENDLSVEIRVRDPRFYADVAFGGAVGAGEAYVRGYWQAQELTQVVQLLLRNRAALEGMDRGFVRLRGPLKKALHWLNRNTRRGSRRNIAAHYDIGNEFFALWLDRRMMYSAAVFETDGVSLEQASTVKLDRICGKLQLGPNDRVMEIGTGWGGFAMHAAEHYGCHVTTTTISREQYEFARERVRATGLEDRITLLLKDYRELSPGLDGCFDKLVSIEMIEAVGHEHYDRYFDTCCRLLKPDGLMCIQAITIADQRYEAVRRSVDFIQRYIFPGGGLPSVTALAASLTRSSDLRIVHCEDIGPHYAETLRHWHDRFLARIDAIRKLGHTDEFIRLWKYYLCYCEGAFIERAIGNVQVLLMRPENRREPFLS